MIFSFLSKNFVYVFKYLYFFIIFFQFPFFWIKRKILRLDDIKKNLFLFLHKYYESNLDEKDFKFEEVIFPCIIIKHKDKIALSYSTLLLRPFSHSFKTKKGIYLRIDDYCISDYFDLPIILDLKKAFNKIKHSYIVKQTLDIHFVTGSIRDVSLHINLIPKFPTMCIHASISLEFDSKMNLNSIKKQSHDGRLNFGNILFDHKVDKYMTFEDLILLFILQNNTENIHVTAVLPEIIIPSAYDFTSEDFKNRLLLAEMLIY